MKLFTVLTAVTFSASLALAAPPAPTHLTQSDLRWQQPFGPQGPSFAFVSGTFNDKKPAVFFLKMAGGADSGWHTHSEDYSAVVVAGTLTEQQGTDAAETPLPTGTYFTQPAKVPHRNGCQKGADCIIMIRCDHGADTTVTTRDGKPVPMPGK